MKLNLRYGANATLALELPPEAMVTRCDAPRGEPLACFSDAVDRALAEPIEFPPLARAVVPGDKVVLALANAVPQAGTIVARTVETLLSAGVSARDITLLRASDSVAAPNPLDKLPSDVRAEMHVETHDPGDRRALGYLAASEAGDPIYISRAMHEADLVVLIGCQRLGESLGYYGFRSAAFPTFSDAASLARFRSPKSRDPREHERLLKAADEAHWLLGMQFTIQVVPGVHGGVMHVLAGALDAVFREGTRCCRQTWSQDIPGRADLVVATIEGDSSQQTWDNVARALAAASQAVRDEGAVAICCELSAELGPAMQLVAGGDDPAAVLRAIGKRSSADARAAAEVVRALERGPIYLLSQLDDELVEELGMVPLSPEGVSRLAARYRSCIVLPNAQHALVEAVGDDASAPATARSKYPR